MISSLDKGRAVLWGERLPEWMEVKVREVEISRDPRKNRTMKETKVMDEARMV